jgi:hypothetical protein
MIKSSGTALALENKTLTKKSQVKFTLDDQNSQLVEYRLFYTYCVKKTAL